MCGDPWRVTMVTMGGAKMLMAKNPISLAGDNTSLPHVSSYRDDWNHTSYRGGRVDMWNKVNICGGGLPASSAFMFLLNFVDITHFNDLSKMFDVNILTNNK